MRAAQEYLWRHDVVVAEASNDFDSTDHQGGMYWPHAIAGNGVVKDNEGGVPVVPSCIPGTPLFARLVPLGEFAAGAALIAGFWPRMAATVAFLMVLNFHFATSAFWSTPSES
jgi:uncharacterized membrane protein YphA (DoxX/SURF4 family)